MHTERTPEGGDRREQILDAALSVFGARGYQKATTKDIADAAGISPGLIYHYFKDKEDLFRSLLRERGPIFKLVAQPEALTDLPLHEVLTRIGYAFFEVFRDPAHAAMFRLLISEAVSFDEIGELFYRVAAQQVLSFICIYLQAQIDLGRIRPVDPLIAARSFTGMLVVHVIAREILRQPEALATPDERIIATAVAIATRGLEERSAS